MLWLCICLPRLPFEALSLDDAKLSVVTETLARKRRIVVASKAAERLGIARDTDYATAAMMCTELKAFDRNLAAERRALERLAIWAYQWSSQVILHATSAESPEKSREKSQVANHSMIWLEIAASFKLFGGRAAFLKRIEKELKELKYDYRLGIAYSLEGAALLARANRRVIAATESILRRNIRKLPITLLALPPTVLFELERAGIRSIETCIDLPKDAVARRFGPQINTHIDKLLGRIADPRATFQLPKKYRARCELGAEVDNTEALLFPLRRMLHELQGYLRAIDCGIQRFVLHLKHRQGTTRIVIGCSAPERDAGVFFSLVRERFERLSLSETVIGIDLQVDRFMPAAIRQKELFTNSRQTTEQFQIVLDKLTARLGTDAVQGCKLVADHRPEKAWSYTAPAAGMSSAASVSTSISGSRPLWLLTEPRRIRAPAEPMNPERIEGVWWDGGDVRRDYYFVRAANGADLWIYCDRGNDEWFLHGLCG